MSKIKNPIFRTSQEWMLHPNYSNIIILDSDGWDRSNYEFSFYRETITEEEFKKRLFSSTVQSK